MTLWKFGRDHAQGHRQDSRVIADGKFLSDVLDRMCQSRDLHVRATGFLLRETASQAEVAALERSYRASERGETADPSDEAIVRRLLSQSSKQISDAAPLVLAMLGVTRSD